MTKRNTRSQKLSQRERPVVVVEFNAHASVDGAKALIEQARQLKWRLISLNYRFGLLPDKCVVQGAILSRRPDDPLVRQLLERGCPVVRLGARAHPDDHLMPAVLPDLHVTGCLAADHFAERGFTHFGYVGRLPWSDHKEIYDGFKQRAEERGGEVHLLQFESETPPSDPQARYLHRRELLAAWLRRLPKPLGLFTFVDSEAALLCNMCLDEGIAVPEEVAILGNGNFPAACECSMPTLSSVVPNHVRRVETAVHILQRLMTGKKLAKTAVKIPPGGVVVRESTDMLAMADPVVAAALNHVWDHLHLKQSVTDVACHVGVSRRALERGFQKCLGRGLAAERHRKRLEVLAQLLRTTDEPPSKLAKRVGFGTLVYLHQSFRRKYGMTPRQYRLSIKNALNA